MPRPSRKGAPNWTDEEWDELFNAFPPTGAHPTKSDLEALAARLGRSADAIGWSWEDASAVLQGRESTSSLRQQDYLRRRGWLPEL
jgi:hypothetical protein